MPIPILLGTATPLSVLEDSAFFGDLGAERLARIASSSRLEAFAEGAQVYRIGEAAVDMYILVQGRVRLAIGMGSRQASAGDVLRPGDVFGWAALTPPSRVRIATASGLTTCSLLCINGDRLAALMEADHTLGYRVTTRLNRLITGTLTAFAAG
ncbi:MAG: cyclic nucleotide-binding domain-containing protein [Caldimonas sp.]